MTRNRTVSRLAFILCCAVLHGGCGNEVEVSWGHSAEPFILHSVSEVSLGEQSWDGFRNWLEGRSAPSRTRCNLTIHIFAAVDGSTYPFELLLKGPGESGKRVVLSGLAHLNSTPEVEWQYSLFPLADGSDSSVLGAQQPVLLLSVDGETLVPEHRGLAFVGGNSNFLFRALAHLPPS